MARRMPDMNHDLRCPTREELLRLVHEQCSSGLWKIGGCYQDLLFTRTNNVTHYSPQYFDHAGAICRIAASAGDGKDA